MKKLLIQYGILLFATLILSACGEEEYIYPDLITEMTCLKTDSEGIGTEIITDDGQVWHLQEGNLPDSLTADSTYRVVSRFAPITDSDAKVYSLWKVISPLPKPEREYQSTHTDPVSLQSIWRSGDYLNMVLQVLVKDQEHDLSFIESALRTNETNKEQTLILTLYHDRKGDVEGFYQKFYLSVPLWHYKGILNKGDQIVFQLNTYKEGVIQRTFTY